MIVFIIPQFRSNVQTGLFCPASHMLVQKGTERMMTVWKRMVCVGLLLCLLAVPVRAVELEVAAPSAILMETATGTVLFEKNAHERLAPASVTKVMTLLLVMEALESGQLDRDTPITATPHAASMGGSQIWLEEGETMTADEMKAFVGASMARHKVPRYIDFVDSFPMNAAGKILKYKMREEAAKKLGLDEAGKK